MTNQYWRAHHHQLLYKNQHPKLLRLLKNISESSKTVRDSLQHGPVKGISTTCMQSRARKQTPLNRLPDLNERENLQISPTKAKHQGILPVSENRYTARLLHQQSDQVDSHEFHCTLKCMDWLGALQKIISSGKTHTDFTIVKWNINIIHIYYVKLSI